MTHIVQDLLTLSRFDSGKDELKLTRFSFSEAVQSLYHAVYMEARRHDHQLKLELEPDLPAIVADRERIVQVMMNVVSNAIKYTPVGSVIEIHTDQKEQWVTVSVSDNGPGIPDEQKPRIFDMFYSGANKVVDSRRSLGLGLSLCKSIVTAHGGTISVSDNQPNGTVFTFTLPAGKVELHE